MSTSNSQSWGNAPVGVFTVLLIIFLIWVFADRPFFRNTGHDIKATVQDAGHDLKSSGRDLSDSIRHDVQ